MVRATTRDSGIYTCSVDSRSEATVSVHVIQGNLIYKSLSELAFHSTTQWKLPTFLPIVIH